MITALMFLALIGWGYWLIFRDMRSPRVTTPPPAPTRQATRTTTPLGLEDDPDQWHVWTALDERQLIRLLTDSAPINRPATNSTDEAVPQVEHKDTP